MMKKQLLILKRSLRLMLDAIIIMLAMILLVTMAIGWPPHGRSHPEVLDVIFFPLLATFFTLDFLRSFITRRKKTD